jgi:ubiquinone/menaquinone biosynthesis C-methylase UbiE
VTLDETEAERVKRHHQRTLFDGVASLYEETRPGYPRELVEFVVATAGIGAGATVLEVGCGTGQLTEALVPYGFALTAIDIGASMIDAARRRVGGPGVSFGMAPFEELDAADASLDLIISGAAFHWIDPEVRFVKSARLLRPGGWLAVVGNSDQYDEPLETALNDMWQARGDTSGSWVTLGVDSGVMASTGLFGPAIQRSWTERITRSAAEVIGVENTRSIPLSWPDDVRASFSEELRAYLGSQDEVHLTVESPVTMAPVLR